MQNYNSKNHDSHECYSGINFTILKTISHIDVKRNAYVLTKPSVHLVTLAIIYKVSNLNN